MEFSEKLMSLRKQAGLSQEQLADRLGVTRQSVSKWESGAAFSDIVKLISLSKIFGVSVGLLSFGCIALGLLSLGVIAVGTLSFGVVALGLLAFGVCAMGLYAGGVCAVGSKIAVGVAAAAGETAVGYDADAANVLLWGSGLSRGEVEAFLRAHHPNLWEPLLRFFSELGAHIR